MSIKMLNLYAGAGGNRTLWDGDIEVTAVEHNSEIARIYKDRFPNDNVIVADAHDFLLKNYMNYDFIWSSPPCPTHSDIRRCGTKRGQNEAVYPDMTLYQEIILLMEFSNKNTLWVIENVKPYYTPLISAQKAGRHLFWANFYIGKFLTESSNISNMNKEIGEKKHGFNLDKYSVDKRRVYRNCVDAKLGKYIFDCAFKYKQQNLFIK